VENPENGKTHDEKKGCTSLSEKKYSGVVISDQEFDCFSPLLVGGEGVFIQVEG